MLSPCEDDSGDEGPVPQEDRALTQGVLKTLAGKLDDLSTCNELIGKHGAALQRSLSELEELRGCSDSVDKVKAVNERATLFRITSNAMINVSSRQRVGEGGGGGAGGWLVGLQPRQRVAFFNEAAGAAPVTCVVLKPQACRDFLDVAETHSRRWQRALQYEKEQRHHLEETIEQLAKQHNSLERAWRENPTSYTGEACLVWLPRGACQHEKIALLWPVVITPQE